MILPTLSEGEKVYADLQNLRACDNPSATIPEKIVTTSARQDLVLVREKEFVLMELTIPHNSLEAMNNAQRRKKSKENYQLVLSEMDKQGLKASLVTLEVGALGHSLLQTHSEFRCVFPTLSKKTVRQLFDEAGKIAITCSYIIFRARSETTWNRNKVLQG